MSTAPRADRLELQHRLFARLSAMFAGEVPMYDRSLAVNDLVNGLVCEVLSLRFAGLRVTGAEVARAGAERHGAIRIGRADEYRWVARFFAAFAMEPHNFYPMTDIGPKSQPVIATAFRSAVRPEHRVFTSLLVTERFEGTMRARIEEALAQRQVFPQRARDLIERGEAHGGLTEAEGDELIHEACTRIFKWTGRARDHQLYTDLCGAGLKIAADIACFDSHHLNHLTPNTLCMDLFTAVMKRCMGQVDANAFEARAHEVIRRLAASADAHWVRLHLPHLSAEAIGGFAVRPVAEAECTAAVQRLRERMADPSLGCGKLHHRGFKEFTEGPPGDTPVLLRQDSYRALPEPVLFTERDGSTVAGEHTARFGEIEERFYAMTPAGRALYDRCLAQSESVRTAAADAMADLAAHERSLRSSFAAIPKTLGELVAAGLVYAQWSPTPRGIAARGSIPAAHLCALAEQGFVFFEGIRYEDFLPISAAGIFASNLSQYGTRPAGTDRRSYTKADLEAIMGRTIIDADAACAARDAASRTQTLAALGLGPGGQ